MTPMKKDDLSPEHRDWLVESRADNQRTALGLFKLLEKYPNKIKSRGFTKTAQTLIAVCFSLWRAAFLADKTGKREAVFDDAKTFLGKLIVDNAINYSQDRNAREWTFNYYANNAQDGLHTLAERWTPVDKALTAETKAPKGTTFYQHRWNRHHSF
jgi:hypothetical protein